MNKLRKKLDYKCYTTGLAGLVLGFLIFLVPVSAFGQAYEGAEYCKTCHEANYNDWKASGHPYKLMKVT